MLLATPLSEQATVAQITIGSPRDLMNLLCPAVVRPCPTFQPPPYTLCLRLPAAFHKAYSTALRFEYPRRSWIGPRPLSADGRSLGNPNGAAALRRAGKRNKEALAQIATTTSAPIENYQETL